MEKSKEERRKKTIMDLYCSFLWIILGYFNYCICDGSNRNYKGRFRWR